MSKYNIQLLESEDKNVWDEFVKSSDGGSFFHLYDWLKISEQKTGFKLLPLAVKKNNQIKGIVPFFLKKFPGFTVYTSPPPKMSTPWAGPVFEFDSDKPYKVEKNFARIIDDLHEYLTDALGADYIDISTVPELLDIRPFKWNGYYTTPSYTYFLDIEDTDNVYKKFDGRIRTGVRKAEKNDQLSYHHDESSFLNDIINLVEERYSEQGLRYALNKSVFKQVMQSDLKKHICVTAVSDDQGVVTGNILIIYKNRVHHWIGGVQPLRNYSEANEFLHWNGIKLFSEEGYKEYEFMGGNTRHLCDHKSKYSGRLVTYYNLDWGNTKGKIVNKAYHLFRGKK